MPKLSLIIENRIELSWQEAGPMIDFHMVSTEKPTPELCQFLQSKHAQKIWMGYGFYRFFTQENADGFWVTTWSCGSSCD